MQNGRPRVLVVEDEALIAHFITEELSDSRFEVVGVAATAEEALRIAQASRVELALVDIKLRGAGDGIHVAARLREQNTTCVIVTGSVDPETLARIQRLQPTALLRKPFTPESLITALERAAASAKTDSP
jgi:CheY-like chemotaxis protein